MEDERAVDMYTVKRNTGWNANLPGWSWLVIDAGGCVVSGSDLASIAQDRADRLNRGEA